MKTIFSAQVLDLWDLHLTQHQGLFAHFERLASQDKLPTLDNLISEADALVHRYASDTAFETALSSTRFNKCPERYKFQTALPVQATDSSDANGEFTGDQVLANTIAFRRDILLYTELSDAISDGDIGRVCEVLKLLIFFFAGASKQNYTSILLDVYCLFKFEATKELKDAIWNNWLVSLTEELGKCVPDDQLQEWHNRFHEDMVPKHGGSEQVHYFRGGRKMEHASKDVIDAGYTTLEKGKLAELLRTSTERAEVMATVRRHRRGHPPSDHPPLPNPSNEESNVLDSDNDSDDGDSDSVQTGGAKSDHNESDNPEYEEEEEGRTIGGSGWEFHMDNDSRDSDGDGSEAEDVEDDEYSADPDVDVDRWAMENDLAADE
ncbi:hypothetical protein B0H14DRAFT_2365511 [Mycena olivaceomarginata]|nr:hypothetical protein B0H14DRAFT_2365511 [Mycena olivaceomarginata]